MADISKYLTPSQRARWNNCRGRKVYNSCGSYSGFNSSKENLYTPPRGSAGAGTVSTVVPIQQHTHIGNEKPIAAGEILDYIGQQEEYIEQLEKESKFCRTELSNLLSRVRDVISENEQLSGTANNSKLATESSLKRTAVSEPFIAGAGGDNVFVNPKSTYSNSKRRKDTTGSNTSVPNIVFEARISELEAELIQANMDLKRAKNDNEELCKKMKCLESNYETMKATVTSSSSGGGQNCEVHRKHIELLQKEKTSLEENTKQLQKSLEEAKIQQKQFASKRYINELLQMERSQAELEVKHLRDELDRQHERVRELQHEMARRVAEERATAERRYNNQVDQLGGDLSNQWEQVAKLQLELERQKRYENDVKRDLGNRSAQIEELKMELRSNRATFLADMAQSSAEKQSLEQEITALRLQLDRSLRDHKTDAARLNAEINSLRQRLDRTDADLLHSKREVLRLNDDIACLEKEVEVFLSKLDKKVLVLVLVYKIIEHLFICSWRLER